jgi:hypothetical protein
LKEKWRSSGKTNGLAGFNDMCKQQVSWGEVLAMEASEEILVFGKAL